MNYFWNLKYSSWFEQISLIRKHIKPMISEKIFPHAMLIMFIINEHFKIAGMN